MFTWVTCVQKKRGTEAQAMNSAELAAMFDLRVLPQLLQPCLPPTPLGYAALRAAYETACKTFAIEAGLPYKDVFYPFFLSLDNCKKHPWLRRLLLEPRLSNEEITELQARESAAIEAELDRQGDAAWYAAQGAQVQEVLAYYSAPTLQQAQQRVPERIWKLLRETRAAYAALDRTARRKALLQRVQPEAGLTWLEAWRRDRAWEMPWMRVIRPEQFMPLSMCSPEIHMAVEHMVRTLKAYVRRAYWLDTSGADPRKAATYQQYMQRGVAEKGNGDAGLRHIRGSLRKLPHTLRILAAAKGERLIIEHTFGESRGRGESRRVRRTSHEVLGTAGGYIADSRWH